MTPEKKVSVSFSVSVSVRSRLEALKAQRARFTGRWVSTRDLVAEAVERLLAAEGLAGRNEPNAGLDGYRAPMESITDPDQAHVNAQVSYHLAKRDSGASSPGALTTKEVVEQMGSLVERFGSMALTKMVARSFVERGYRRRHTETGNIWVLDSSARTSTQVAAASSDSEVQPVPETAQSGEEANPANARQFPTAADLNEPSEQPDT